MPWPAVIAAGIGLAGGIWANAANAREARRNREFQERMSSTAHQREVADLRKAGVNAALRGMGGSSTPSGDRAEMRDPTEGSRGVSSALMMRAQLRLLDAQTDREGASAQLLRTQSADIVSTAASGRLSLITIQRDLAQQNLDQLRANLPAVLAKAKEEVQLTASSARAASARAALDEAAAAGAENLEAFEKRVGESGPWVRTLFQLLRSIRR